MSEAGQASKATQTSKASQALENLRGFVILMVLAFHSFMAYMLYQPASALSFDASPQDWTAHPMVDSHRWLGFDLFGAFQFLHLMQLMCFLSGVFVWPSLVRKGAKAFLLDRILRLGAPFLFGVYLLMPLTYFPVYLVGAVDPSWSAFWSHWVALPFWPCGPLWFLAFVLVLNVAAAGFYVGAPRAGALFGRVAAYAADRPGHFYLGFLAVTALAYLPMAALFDPWSWVEFGPFALQPAIAPQYAVFFLAGLAIGAPGIGRGLLAFDGALARHWGYWLAGTALGFSLWIAAAAMIVGGNDSVLLRVARELSLVLFAASACFASIAVFFRFATTRRSFLGSISDNAYGIYLFHYLFVIWGQYALLGFDAPAIVKGPIVLALTLALSWLMAAIVGSAPAGARLMRGERRASMASSSSTTSAKVDQPQPGLSD